MSQEILELLKIGKKNPYKRKELFENEEIYLKIIKIVELNCEKELKNEETVEMNSEELLKEIKALNIRKELFLRLNNVKYNNAKQQ
tara:strand:+ start:227 stop:484 length:258 start_codon:yes stop_codon:yes gene_type:complete